MYKKRRKYDSEFKRQAVQMVTEDGKSCRAVEKDLGLGQGILYRWKRELSANPGNCFPGNGRVQPSSADVQRLVKEVEQLRRERDVLKKALGIFFRTSGRSTLSLQNIGRN